MKKFVFPLLLTVALALAACGEKTAATAEPAPADPVLQGKVLTFPAGHPQLARIGVAEATAARQLTVELPARLVWNEERTQRLYPAFAGRVERIAADVGQAVKPGTVLAQLASPDFAVAQADTARAQVDARLTAKVLARQRELFEAGIISRKDLDQAEADTARAQAEVQRAEARTRLYGASGGVDQRLALTAGIAGVVVERNLNPGQELRPDQGGNGAPPLFVVSDPSSLWVVIDAREAQVDALRPGMRFELVVPSLPGQAFEGQVSAVSDFIDPSTRTFRVRGLVTNAGRKLKAEMLGSIRVQRSLPEGVMIPATALKLEGTGHCVLVQVAPGAFESREVEVGLQTPGQALVTAGLKAGDKVVTDNMLLLSRQYHAAQKAAAPAAASRAKAEAAQ